MNEALIDALMGDLDLEESPEGISKALEAATKDEQAGFLDCLLMEALLVDTLGKRRIQAIPAKHAAPRTIPLVFRLLSAAALLMIVVGFFWMWHARFRYSEPRLILGSSTAGGPMVKTPRRGECVKAGPAKARLVMGGYCDLALDPGAEIIVRGEPHREAIELVEGRVVSEITPQRGEYTVYTPGGWVKVKGTKFATSVEYPTAPKSSAGESRPKESATIIVAVTSGVVEYQLGGQTGMLHGGETRTFVPSKGTEASPGATKKEKAERDETKEAEKLKADMEKLAKKLKTEGKKLAQKEGEGEKKEANVPPKGTEASPGATQKAAAPPPATTGSDEAKSLYLQAEHLRVKHPEGILEDSPGTDRKVSEGPAGGRGVDQFRQDTPPVRPVRRGHSRLSPGP